MQEINVALLPEEINAKTISDDLVIVIDVLRASSTIVTAFAAGAEKIIPIYNPEEARNRALAIKSSQVLLCGERGGKKLPGFDMGNSPLEYRMTDVKNKTLLLSTTNGVKMLERVRNARKIIVGSFLNIDAVIDYCLADDGKIMLACSGDRGHISLEDTVCAGMILDQISQLSADNDLNDDLLLARELYHIYGHDLLEMMKSSTWGQNLMTMNLTADLVFCAQTNIYHHIPVVKKTEIICRS